MTVFGDYDPDDAWDAGDPVDVQLDVLTRRVLWLVDHRDADTPNRIRRIAEDIAAIRRRVAGGT